MAKNTSKIAQLQAKLVAPLLFHVLVAVAHDPLLKALRRVQRAADHGVRRLAVETILHAFWDHPEFAVGLCHAVLRAKHPHGGGRRQLDLGKAWLLRDINDVDGKLHTAQTSNNTRATRRCSHTDEDFRAVGVTVRQSDIGTSLSARMNAARLGVDVEEPLSPGSFLHDAGAHLWRQRRTDGTWMNPISAEALKEKLAAAGQTPTVFRSQITSFDSSRPFFGDDREIVVDRGEVVFNTFDGWQLEPRPGRWPNIRRVLINLVAGDHETYDYFLDWIAAPLQKLRHKGKTYKTRTAVVFHGGQGTGKGTLENIVRAIYGDKYVVVMGQDALDGRFTGDLENALFVVANEVMSSTNRSAQTENKLKTWVTDSKIPIEKKYQHPVVVENMFNIMFTSNDDRPVIVPAGDRRYTVIKTWPHQLPAWLTDAVYADLAGDKLELRAFLHHLLHRRVRNNVGKPMTTDARAEVQAATAPSDVKFAKALADEGWLAVSAPWADAQRPKHKDDTTYNEVVLDRYNWPSAVLSSRLHDVYRLWCAREGLKPFGSPKLGRTVKQHVEGSFSTWARVGGVGMQIWNGLPMHPSTTLLLSAAPVAPTTKQSDDGNDNPDVGTRTAKERSRRATRAVRRPRR